VHVHRQGRVSSSRVSQQHAKSDAGIVDQQIYLLHTFPSGWVYVFFPSHHTNYQATMDTINREREREMSPEGFFQAIINRQATDNYQLRDSII
jgi:hypothetical protein